MTTPPPRSVLRKFAAPRRRVGHPGAQPTWVSFVTGSAPQTGTQARIGVLGGPRRFTLREMEVQHLIARGETDPGVADRLYLSRRTISCDDANILAKLEVPVRTPATMTAARIWLL